MHARRTIGQSLSRH